jgi:hypothetical protein
MPLLTIFALPKPFTDPHVTLIQRNALASWRALGSDVEVLLMGEDEGIAAAAREFGVRHIRGAATNEYGTPVLDWAFARAAEFGSGQLLCYANADIVLRGDFLAAVKRLGSKRLLAVGQKWDVEVSGPLDVDDDLGDWARRVGTLHPVYGIDYFVFPRTLDFQLPPFAVGRPRWDNWMIGRARRMSVPIVDLTQCTTVIHQKHGYGHVPQQRGSEWEGPEADRNLELGEWIWRFGHTTSNATHVLTARGTHRALAPRYLRARWDEFVALSPKLDWARALLAWIRARRASRASKRGRSSRR